jgi:3-hydroxyacyl-[acyl-carrier-protein] dehydratase
MRLQDSLYRILAEKAVDNGHQFDISLNANHVIYQAHFPGEPITPGVCIMQIAVELLEHVVQAPVQLQCVKNIKFLNIITPDEVSAVTYTFHKMTQEEGMVKVQVEVTSCAASSFPSGPSTGSGTEGNETTPITYAKLSLICTKSA